MSQRIKPPHRVSLSTRNLRAGLFAWNDPLSPPVSPLSLLTLLLVCSLLRFAYGQDPAHTLFTERDGLLSNEVYSVVQDSMGYIWFGTDNGLCRYDGQQFRVYNSPSQKSLAMHALQVDRTGRIWMSNFSGQVFYVEQDSLKAWQPMVEAGISALQFTCRLPFLYILSSRGIHVYDTREAAWVRFVQAEEGGLSPNSFHGKGPLAYLGCSIRVFDGKEFLPTDISRVGAGQERKSCVRHYSAPIVSSGVLYSMVVSKSAGTLPPFFLNENRQWVPLSLPGWADVRGEDGRINRVIKIAEEEYWVVGNGGAAVFAPQKVPHPPLAPVFRDYRISDMIQDREGNYWLSTLGEGVLFVPNMDSRVYTPEDAGPYSLGDLKARALEVDGQGRLWLGHQNGQIDIWSPSPPFSERIEEELAEVNTFRWSEPQRAMYVGQYGGHIYKGTQRIASYVGASVKDLFPFRGTVIMARPDRTQVVPEQPQGNVLGWKGTEGFVLPTALATDRTKPRILSNGMLDLRYHRTWAVHVDTLWTSDFRIWQGYADQLVYTHANGTYRVVHDPISGEPIQARTIEQSRHDSLIWVGTLNQGLYGIRDTQVVYHISQEQGLPVNRVPRLHLEEDTLWMASPGNVVRLVPKDSSIAVFNKADGLASIDVQDVIPWRGDIWLATYQGVQQVPRRAWAINAVPPTHPTDGIGPD